MTHELSRSGSAHSHVRKKPSGPAEAVDSKLVRRAVVSLNEANRRQGLAWVRSLGQLLVELFFDGDASRIRLHARRNVSLRAVAQHPQLEVSTSSLWYALAIYEQLQQLPKDVADALSVSHHRRLVSVRDLSAKVRLAERAARQGWSVRVLASEVSRQRARETVENRAGRPPLPGFVKAIRRLPRAMEQGLEGLDEHAVRRLGPQEVQGLLKTVTEQVERLELLRGRLVALRDAEATEPLDGWGEGEEPAVPSDAPPAAD